MLLSFFAFKLMQPMGLFEPPLIIFRCVPYSHNLSKTFTLKVYNILSKVFSVSNEMIMWFWFLFCYCCFVLCFTFFIRRIMLHLLCKYFAENFCIDIHRRNGSVILFVVSLCVLGIKVTVAS